MKSRATREFWDCYAKLPPHVRAAAQAKHRLWQENPFHPSLHFKPVQRGLWSIRVTRDYRAPARWRGDLVVWSWIGSHAEYDSLLD